MVLVTEGIGTNGADPATWRRRRGRIVIGDIEITHGERGKANLFYLNGEGGEFDLVELHDVLAKFMSERL